MINTDFEIEDRSADLIKRTSEAGIKAYKKAGKKASDLVKESVKTVRTGLLKESIGHKTVVKDGVPIVDVGAKKKVKGKTAHHAHLVEDGTGSRKHKTGRPVGSMPASPFLKPNIEKIQDILENTVREEMSKLSDS